MTQPNFIFSFSSLCVLLRALIVIWVVTRLTGKALKYFYQPPVAGEILGGILLGPSCFGMLFPLLQSYLLPPSAIPQIGMLANLGVILFMFLIGLDLDKEVLKSKGLSVIAISQVSVVFPFLLGTLFAYFFFSELATEGVSYTAFTLFLGVAMSITAFPVLARILTDLKIHKTEIGILALSCAAIDDVTAWCLLALILSIVKSSASGAISTVVYTVVFALVLFFVVRPAAPKFLRYLKERLNLAFLILLAGALFCAYLTENIGIHAIFGAFIFGVVVSNDEIRTQKITVRFGDLIKAFLLPAFFAFSGMRTQLFLISTQRDWAICAFIILLATIGKFGGAYLVARLRGYSREHSSMLGILMNTRGLVELIVLNIGLDLGIISPRLFAMMVMMALVTTFMTSPLIIGIMKRRASVVVVN